MEMMSISIALRLTAVVRVVAYLTINLLLSYFSRILNRLNKHYMSDIEMDLGKHSNAPTRYIFKEGLISLASGHAMSRQLSGSVLPQENHLAQSCILPRKHIKWLIEV